MTQEELQAENLKLLEESLYSITGQSFPIEQLTQIQDLIMVVTDEAFSKGLELGLESARRT
jgi:7-keto-8-aminopelargonate synthetase-like enzyme